MTFKYLLPKDSTVNPDVCQPLLDAEPFIHTYYQGYGLQGVVTSAKDGQHSQHSAHYVGRALDLRSRDIISGQQVRFGQGLVRTLNQILAEGEFYCVMEGDHYHLEWSDGVPNIKGWQKGKYFYVG